MAEAPLSFTVMKTNRRGKRQERLVELDFATGKIFNRKTNGKVQKTHDATAVMFAERIDDQFLVIHFPDKKKYKLAFASSEEREHFCSKLTSLCKMQSKMRHPQEAETFNPDDESFATAAEQEDFSFAMKMSRGDSIELEDVIVYLHVGGVALCDPAPLTDAAADSSPAINESADPNAATFKVQSSYPFTSVMSWTNEGDYVTLEVDDGSEGGLNLKLKGVSEWEAAEVVRAIQTCVALLMKRVKEKRQPTAARTAAAAVRAPRPAQQAADPKQASMKYRRASVVVDLAAMADFAEDDPDADQEDEADRAERVKRQSAKVVGSSGGARRSSVVQALMSNDPMASQEAMMRAASAAHEAALAVEAGEGDGEAGIMIDMVEVMTDMQFAKPAPGAKVDKVAERRRSVVMDAAGIDGEEDADGQRGQRAELLIDLAAFIDDVSGEGAMETVQEEGEGEEGDPTTSDPDPDFGSEEEDEMPAAVVPLVLVDGPGGPPASNSPARTPTAEVAGLVDATPISPL